MLTTLLLASILTRANPLPAAPPRDSLAMAAPAIPGSAAAGRPSLETMALVATGLQDHRRVRVDTPGGLLEIRRVEIEPLGIRILEGRGTDDASRRLVAWSDVNRVEVRAPAQPYFAEHHEYVQGGAAILGFVGLLSAGVAQAQNDHQTVRSTGISCGVALAAAVTFVSLSDPGRLRTLPWRTVFPVGTTASEGP